MELKQSWWTSGVPERIKCYDSNQEIEITKEFPPKKSALSRYSGIDGVDPQNGLEKPPKPGEPVTMWLLALEDTEQQEFMQMLSDLFGQYTDATGNVIQGSHELANTISGEVARISSESNRLTTEEVKLAELLVDAASYNKEIMIVKVVSNGPGGFFSTSPGSYYKDGSTKTYPFQAFNDCTMIALGSNLLGQTGAVTIGGKKIEETDSSVDTKDFDQFKGVWWVFVHELIHANPLYDNEYYDDEKRQRQHLEYWAAQGINRDPDKETWRFLYKELPKPGAHEVRKRKQWPSAWDPYSKEAITERTEAKKGQPPLLSNPEVAVRITCTVSGDLSRTDLGISTNNLPDTAPERIFRSGFNQPPIQSVEVKFLIEVKDGSISMIGGITTTQGSGDSTFDRKLRNLIPRSVPSNIIGTATVTITVTRK